MRYTTVLLLAASLALAGCSDAHDPKPTVTETVTATQSLSAAEQKQACVDAWAVWFEEQPDDYDPDTDPLPSLPACEGRADSSKLGFEALRARNEAARKELDACLEDPACTEWP